MVLPFNRDMKRTAFLIISVIAIVTVSVAAYYRSNADTAPDFVTAPVTRGDIVQTIEATGTLQALVNTPTLLLADEPTGNLDTRTSIEVMGIFQRLNEEQGLTIVLVTHEPDIAEYGTRIVAFRDGRVLHDRPVETRRVASVELAHLEELPVENSQLPTTNLQTLKEAS